MPEAMGGRRAPVRAAPRWVTWFALWCAALFGPRALVWAQDTLRVWEDGEVLTAAELNANFAALESAIPRGVLGHEIVTATQEQDPVAAGVSFPDVTWRVACPPGKVVLGGGCDAGNGEWHFYSSAPEGNGWVCRAECMGNAKSDGGGTGQTTFTAHAICALPQ
jgi:hypothetical protein